MTVATPQMGDLSLGARLRLARERAGMTKAAAALAIGVSRDSLSDYEDDKTEPGSLKLKNAAEVYGTSADWLLWGTSRVKSDGKRPRLKSYPGRRSTDSPSVPVQSPIAVGV